MAGLLKPCPFALFRQCADKSAVLHVNCSIATLDLPMPAIGAMP